MELFQKVYLSLVSLAQVEFKPAHTTACSSTGPPGSGSEVKGQYAGRKAPGLYFLNPLRSSGYTFYCFPGGGRKGLIMSKLIPRNNKHLNIQDRIYIESSLDSGLSFKDMSVISAKIRLRCRRKSFDIGW